MRPLRHYGLSPLVRVYGQERNAITRRLTVVDLALRGIEADFGPDDAVTFCRDFHPDLHADGVDHALLCRPNSATPNLN